jgi:hypothetical protein
MIAEKVAKAKLGIDEKDEAYMNKIYEDGSDDPNNLPKRNRVEITFNSLINGS